MKKPPSERHYHVNAARAFIYAQSRKIVVVFDNFAAFLCMVNNMRKSKPECVEFGVQKTLHRISLGFFVQLAQI